MTVTADMAAMHSRDRWAHQLQMEIREAVPGRAVVALEVTEPMLNGHSICHGGVIFSLADTAFAHACNSEQPLTVAQGCDIDFLRPVSLGDLLIAEAHETSRGKRSGIYDVSVKDAQGKVVALFRGRSRVAAAKTQKSR